MIIDTVHFDMACSGNDEEKKQEMPATFSYRDHGVFRPAICSTEASGT